MSSRASFEDRRINELLALPTGSNILIYSLDRLGRSVREISNIIAQLRENGINLHVIDKSLVISASTDDINSTILVTILSLTAQIERDLISQRTKLALSRIRMFKKLGRPIKSKFDESKNIICDKSRSINSLAKEFGCSRNAIRHLRKTRTA
jgi:DNA invertase Pin-like site-specific DNA recombinase